MNSLVGQSDAIGEIAGGPAIGVVGTVSGMHGPRRLGPPADVALALYGRALRHGGREPSSRSRGAARVLVSGGHGGNGASGGRPRLFALEA